MNDSPDNFSLADYLETFQRRKKIFFAVFGLVFGVALLLAISLPSVYVSSTEMRIDLEGPSVDLLEPLALTSYAEQYVDSLRQRALPYARMNNWIENSDIYSEIRDEYSESELVSMLQDNITIDMLTTEVTDPRSGRPLSLITGFVASFRASNPDDALWVADRLAFAYLDADQKIRSERAAAASGFLRAEIDQKRDRINELESRIAEFKEQNAGSLPALMGLNMSVLERTERDIENVDMEMQAHEQDKMFRESQLQEILEKSKTPGRLRQLKNDYLRAVSVYGPDHPDVIRIKRQVAALTDVGTGIGDNEEIQRLQGELAEARQRYSDVHPDVLRLQRELEVARSKESIVASDTEINPRYLQLDAQINAVDLQIAGLRERRRNLKIKYDEIQDRVAQMPEVERQYLKLTRDLNNEEIAFNDLGRRLALAQQTESFETGKTGARLLKTRSATLPGEPSSPPRVSILIFGALAGISLAIGAVLSKEVMDTTVRGKRDIQMILNMPPIAEIPIMHGTASTVRSRRSVLIIGTTILVISAIVLMLRSGA